MGRLGSGLLLLCLFGAASAQNLIQNGHFNGPVGACDTFNIPAGSTLIPGWTVTVGNVDWYTGPPCGWATRRRAGPNSIDLVGDAAGGIGGIQQSFGTVPGRSYLVMFDLAGNYGGDPPAVKPLQVKVAGVTKNYMFDTTGKGQFSMGWTHVKFAFVATSSMTTLEFVSDVSGFGGPDNAGAVIASVGVFAQ